MLPALSNDTFDCPDIVPPCGTRSGRDLHMQNLKQENKPVPMLFVAMVFGLVVTLGWLWAIVATLVVPFATLP